MMTGDRLNIGHDPKRHAAYVDSWVRKLREDPREIYRASRDAQEMSDYLLERGRWRAQGRDDWAEARVPDESVGRSSGEHARSQAAPERPIRGVPRGKPAAWTWRGRSISRDRAAGPER